MPTCGATPASPSREMTDARALPGAPLLPARHRPSSVVPGLGLAGAGAIVAFAVHRAVPSLSPLVVAVVAGALLTNAGRVPEACRTGLDVGSHRMLRIGIVLLGFRLAVSDVAELGLTRVALVVAIVTATFAGTRWLGHRLGVSPNLALLIATGFSICGASAIAAVRGVSEADDDEVALSVALVTLCGSAAMLVLPLLRAPLGLDGPTFGAWVGASVHDVAQVVATAAVGGGAALQAAVVVKLTRVALLAPIISGLSLVRRRAGATTPATSTRPPLMPIFVVGFLAAVAIRSTGLLPTQILAWLRGFETAALAAALFALGTGVKLARFRRLGGRPLVLALGSWLLVASLSFGGVRLVGR